MIDFDETKTEKKPFELTYGTDGVYLTVNRIFGVTVQDTEVMNEIRRKKIRNFNADIITDTIKKADGRPVKIADKQEEEKIDALVEVITNPDKMKAYIKIKPPEGGGKPAGIQEIAYQLKQNGIIYGIKEDVVRALVDNPIYDQNILVAEGMAPINGKNGETHFLVDVHKDRKPIIMEDGSVNYRDLNYIENVHKGQKLCEMTQPTPGIDGKNVVGTVLKAVDGKPAKMVRGRNVYSSEDGLSLYSEIDGQVMYIEGKLSVFSTYEVPADVDNSTGNINFVGNLSVRGNVLSGFVVEVGGNVEVFGVVEAATIKAGGNIILRRGMTGNGKGLLVAGGDIVAKYIENSRVEATNDIKAEAIMHSDVKCGNRLELGGRKGLLVGGIARVGREIEAKVIGSYMATTTNIEVGVDPNVRERYKFLRTDLIKMEENSKKANQAIILLRKMEAAGVLTEEKKELLDKSVRSKIFFDSRISQYKEELAELDEKLQQEVKGRIKVLNYLYPGTRISIGSANMHVKETLQHCTLYKDGVDVRVGPL
jgi:uncharacterized protein (DUF342 family)